MKISTNMVLTTLVGLLLLQSANTYAARCEYIIQNEWSTGFVALVRITNDTKSSINGWSVNWTYTDGSSRTGGWNANFSGNNPYSATNMAWNSRINVGQSVEFGVMGKKGVANSPASKPVVNGAICGQSSSSRVSSRTSSLSSRMSSHRTSSSSFRNSSSSSRSSSSTSSYRSPASVPTSSSSSRSSSAGLLSSSSVSSGPNTSAPVAELTVTNYGLTVYLDSSASTDADGNTLTHTIDFGDGQTIKYPKVWHTYKEAGDYSVVLSVTDGQLTTTKTQSISVQAVDGNKAPIARLTGAREYRAIRAWGTSSFDFENIPLTYEWDFGDGSFAGDALASVYDCAVGETNNKSRLVTLTVSDGELKDTRQTAIGGICNAIYDLMPTALFVYKIEGNSVWVDGSNSRYDIRFNWDFGDGTTATGLIASHTYTTPGTYAIKLNVQGPSLFTHTSVQSVIIGASSSSSSSSIGD